MNATASSARYAFNEYLASKSALKDYTEETSHLIGLLDRLVREHTGFGGSFLDLVEAQQKHGYRPTFRERGDDAIGVLADAYDYCASARRLEPSYRPERGPVAVKTYHLLKDFGVYKATIVRNFHDNDRGREYDHVRGLLARRTQRYTVAELEELFGWLWTSHDECVVGNTDDFSPVEVYTSAQKISRGEAAIAELEALKSPVS